MWEILGGYLQAAPQIVQTLVAISISCLVIISPVVVIVLLVVLAVRDVSIGPLHLSSKKRRGRRTADRRK